MYSALNHKHLFILFIIFSSYFRHQVLTGLKISSFHIFSPFHTLQLTIKSTTSTVQCCTYLTLRVSTTSTVQCCTYLIFRVSTTITVQCCAYLTFRVSTTSTVHCCTYLTFRVAFTLFTSITTSCSLPELPSFRVSEILQNCCCNEQKKLTH